MTAIERLTAADHAAVGCLLIEACADHAARMGADWLRLRDGPARAADRLGEAEIAGGRVQGTRRIGLHTSEAMTRARRLYERKGFVVDGDLPMNFGLRYRRFRLDL